MRRTPRAAVASACALAALAAAGCGSSGHGSYKNTAEPPVPVIVSASIDDQTVQISPRHLGAGPITLVITNQSSTSQQVTLETADTPGSGPGEKAVQTGPISPRETASIQAVVRRGTYDLHVRGNDVHAARLVVGKPRPSAQNDLLTP